MKNHTKGYDQTPKNPDNWLTDNAEENRQFVKVIHLPIGEEWAECTNEEKEQWEHDHQQPAPENVEPVNE